MAMVFKKLLRNPVSLLGLVLLLGFVLVAIFAPVIAPTPERYKDDPYRIPSTDGEQPRRLRRRSIRWG